jgi:photosystem II stability/assembly factor-like uncharacterized protein
LNVNGITVHPQNADIVYVSGDSDPGHKRLFGDLGVFLSRNGGMSWTRISDANATVVSLIPSSLTTACVGTSLGEVFCKDEKDSRWTRVFQAKQTGQSLTVGAVLFDPRDSRVAYVQADSAGVYKTVDAGATWSQILVLARALIRDPATGDLYAGAGRGAIRSTDGGATWMSGDTALTTIEGGGFPVLALGGKYLYAGADYGGFILRSQDKGGSFEVVQRGAVDTRSVHAHLGGNGSVLAGDTGYGIFKAESWNGVWRWKSKNDLPTNGGPVYAFASHPASPDRIFAAAAYALLRSTDGGETWDRNGPSSAGMGHVVDIALDVSNPSRMYALTSGTGVWMTEDAGDSWARLTEDGVQLFSSVLAAEAGENARLYAGGARQGLWGSEAGGRVWRRLASGNPALTDVLAVAVGPGSAKTVWVGTSGYLDGLTYQRGSLYTSADYGENWKEFKLPGAIWKVTQIVFDPIDPAVIYIGGVTIDDTESSTVFRSGDAGATWTAYPTGVSDEIMRLAPDPSSPGRIFAATRAFGLLTIQTAPPTLP